MESKENEEAYSKLEWHQKKKKMSRELESQSQRDEKLLHL